MNIKTLSPFYITVPFINPITEVVCSTYTVKIYVWTGSKLAPPSIPEYTVTKVNAAASSGSDKINIAGIVNDFIEFDCSPIDQTDIQDGDNQVWVKFECYYDDYTTTPFIEAVYLAVKGYGWYYDGQNPQLPTNKILITGNEYKVNRGGRFVVPLMAAEPAVAARSLVINSVSLVAQQKQMYSYNITSNFSYSWLFVETRLVGQTQWQPMQPFDSLNPNRVTLPIENISATFQTRVSAFDLVTGTRIYSNVVTVPPYVKAIVLQNHTIISNIANFSFTGNYEMGVTQLQVSLNGGAYLPMPGDVSSPFDIELSGSGSRNFRIYDTTDNIYSNIVNITT